MRSVLLFEANNQPAASNKIVQLQVPSAVGRYRWQVMQQGCSKFTVQQHQQHTATMLLGKHQPGLSPLVVSVAEEKINKGIEPKQSIHKGRPHLAHIDKLSNAEKLIKLYCCPIGPRSMQNMHMLLLYLPSLRIHAQKVCNLHRQDLWLSESNFFARWTRHD